MTWSCRSQAIALVLLAVVASACGGAPSPAPATAMPPASVSAPSTAASAAGEAISGLFEVDGGRVFLECKGDGSPTVIVEPGLGGDSTPWAQVIRALGQSMRACRYDRAGTGLSQARPGTTDLSVGDRADHLHALLGLAGVQGPYVLVGHSYGGMLTRAFAERYPTETVGLVFVDASHEEQFAPGGWWMSQQSVWNDGAHPVDLVRSREELFAAADLDALPTIVLTNGQYTGEFERQWSVLQDAIASMSSNSLHMVATDAGHDIRADRPELVLDSIVAVVAAARGAPLPSCQARFKALGAECLAGTMVDLLATWDARRAEVEPVEGELPGGPYNFTDDGNTIVVTIDGGRLDVAIHTEDGSDEAFAAQYAAVGDKVTFLWPFDWRLPRTPGVNVARWTTDQNGALRFVQLDAELAEPWLALPWVPCDRRIGSAPCARD